jgi:N-acetylmuramoyl-L-alanine amidase
MMPIRIMATVFDMQVKWDGTANRVNLTGGGLLESGDSYYDADTLYWLSRIISAEARGEPYHGQVAVGAVILNRVEHSSFPDTVSGVIYQKGAFSALTDGQFDQPIAASAWNAARDAMNGWDPSGGAIYYYNPAKTSNKWIRSRPVIKTIGNHVFCK